MNLRNIFKFFYEFAGHAGFIFHFNDVVVGSKLAAFRSVMYRDKLDTCIMYLNDNVIKPVCFAAGH